MNTEDQIEKYAKLYAAALRKLFRNQKAFWTEETVQVAIADGIDPQITSAAYIKLIEDVEEFIVPVALESATDGATKTADQFGGTVNVSNVGKAIGAATVLNLSTQASKSIDRLLPFLRGKKSPEKLVRASIGLNNLQTSGVITRYNKLAGVSGDKVAARQALREIKRHRERRVGTYSTNEIVEAYTEGQDQHFKGLPGIKFKTWVTKADEMVCPICRSLHLQEVPIYELFLSSKGYIDKPVAHPNCRCQLRYRILK